MTEVATFIRLKAKAGKEQEAATFLQAHKGHFIWHSGVQQRGSIPPTAKQKAERPHHHVVVAPIEGHSTSTLSESYRSPVDASWTDFRG
jgi:hypothetical protein